MSWAFWLWIGLSLLGALLLALLVWFGGPLIAIADYAPLEGTGVRLSIIAVILAAIGLYGVMSYLVSQRTREFGIRAAVGATSRDLMGLVLGRSLALVLVGLAFGLLSAAALQRLVRSLLFGVAQYDVLTFSAVPVLLVSVALIASYLPARRAASINPINALRSE